MFWVEDLFKDWTKIIDKKILYTILNRLSILYQYKKITPKPEDVFKAFELCNYTNLKVIIIGQDPYPQPNVATGILLGNKHNTPISTSLRVIQEACIDQTIIHNLPVLFDNSLENWSKQGILMLNSALTVEVNRIGSHIMLWRPFLTTLLRNLSVYNTGIIYVLLGKQAQTLKPYINSKTNYILEELHPSYYARIDKRMPSDIFYTINSILKQNNNTEIAWYYEENLNNI